MFYKPYTITDYLQIREEVFTLEFGDYVYHQINPKRNILIHIPSQRRWDNFILNQYKEISFYNIGEYKEHVGRNIDKFDTKVPRQILSSFLPIAPPLPEMAKNMRSITTNTSIVYGTGCSFLQYDKPHFQVIYSNQVFYIEYVQNLLHTVYNDMINEQGFINTFELPEKQTTYITGKLRLYLYDDTYRNYIPTPHTQKMDTYSNNISIGFFNDDPR